MIGIYLGKLSGYTVFVGLQRRLFKKILCIFPVNKEFPRETGSLQTASTAISNTYLFEK